MPYEQYRPQKMSILPPVVKNLLIINVLVFFATEVIKNQYQVDLTDYLGLHYFTSEYFRPYQFITYMFMHGGYSHIFFNMFALWMFGNALENLWGGKRFLIFYMITGIGAALIYMGYEAIHYSIIQNAIQAFAGNPTPEGLLNLTKTHFDGMFDNPEAISFIQSWKQNLSDPSYANSAVNELNQVLIGFTNSPMVGASGAIFGVLMGFGMLFPNTELFLMFIPIPIKAKYAVFLYGLAELFFGVAQFSGDNIAHFAHLGGMLFGFILIKYWQKRSNRFY
jgi:membrane associated rhomboid family serine protease